MARLNLELLNRVWIRHRNAAAESARSHEVVHFHAIELVIVVVGSASVGREPMIGGGFAPRASSQRRGIRHFG